MKLFSPGDGEGFVVAFVNNLVQLLILAPLCTMVLGFSPDLIYGKILPGVAASFLVGNLFYAWQALALAKRAGMMFALFLTALARPVFLRTSF